MRVSRRERDDGQEYLLSLSLAPSLAPSLALSPSPLLSLSLSLSLPLSPLLCERLPRCIRCARSTARRWRMAALQHKSRSLLSSRSALPTPLSARAKGGRGRRREEGGRVWAHRRDSAEGDEETDCLQTLFCSLFVLSSSSLFPLSASLARSRPPLTCIASRMIPVQMRHLSGSSDGSSCANSPSS